MSPIRTASGASLRTPKNYNSANRSYNYNNNYGYRNYGYNNNRGFYNQRGYYNRWNRGRGNWRGQPNYRNQWNDRRRYNSRSDRSRSKSRSRSYDSRDSRSRSSSYDRSRSRSRSRDNKHRRTRSRSDRKSRSRSPPRKVADTSKSEKKTPTTKQDDPKPTTITVPSTTELVVEPETNTEEPVNDEQDKEMHFAETSAFTRSRWETPDGSPGRKESADVDLSQDEIFDRWDDDKLREYLLKSKGKKIRKESKKSTDSVEQEKTTSKKKKKKAKRESISREAPAKSRRSLSPDASSDSSFSPIHKAPEKKKASDGQEKYLPPEYDDEEDNQSVEMQESSPPHSNKPYYPQEGRKDEKNEAVQYPFAHIKIAGPLPTPAPPPKQPSPVPPPGPGLPSIGEMQVLGPDGQPMRLVPVSIPGPDGNMIQVMQLQPIAPPQAEPPKQPPQPVEPPKTVQPPPPPTTYPMQRQYQRVAETHRSTVQEKDADSSSDPPMNQDAISPFSTNDHAANLRKMEMSQKIIRKPEVLRTRFKPKPAGSWASGMSKREPQVPPPVEIPKKELTPEKITIEQKGQSIPSLVDASGKAKSMDTGMFTEQKIQTITTTQSVRKVLEPMRSDQIWGMGNEEVKTGQIHKKTDPIIQESSKPKGDKAEQQLVTEKISHHEKKRESISKSMSKERDSSENEGSLERKKHKNVSSDESGDELVKRKKDKKKKKKNKKKQRDEEGGAKKKKKKQKEKSIEKSVVVPLEHESIKSKKDLKAFEELNKKGKDDNLVRVVDENLSLSHVRSMVPRKDDTGAKPIFQHLAPDDLASSSSYEDRFVSLFGSVPAEPAPKKVERVDLTKKSVRKFKVNVEGSRAVLHMTDIPISERIRHFKEGTEIATPDQSSQKVSLNISGLSGKTKSEASRSRSRSRSVSSSASSEPPKKVKKKRKKSRRSSSKSSSRSRSRSLPAAYGGDDDKTPGKRRRDDSEGESRRRSRDRYSRSPSSSGDERDRGRRQMYYNRNNQGQGYHYNNRGRGFYQNRNRGWYNYNNRGGWNNRGRWNNNWNQGWNRNQNWRNQRYRDRYSRERSRSRSRSDRSSSSPDGRRSRSPARGKSPERRSSENSKKDINQNQKASHGDTKGTDANASRGHNIFEDEKPPGVD